jgi:FlaA1/EpsC-like NDP-sugar epimerase
MLDERQIDRRLEEYNRELAMKTNSNRVLVTGAAGFIGSHLSESLARAGNQVRAMVHYNFQSNWGWLETMPSDIMKNIEVFPADITDPFAVQKGIEGCELVFHLAALIAIPYSYLAPASYVETNVKGTIKGRGKDVRGRRSEAFECGWRNAECRMVKQRAEVGGRKDRRLEVEKMRR